LKPTAEQVKTFAVGFIPDNSIFDWNSFLGALNELDAKEVVFDNVNTNTISQDEITFKDITPQIAKRISDSTNAAVDKSQIGQTISERLSTLEESAAAPIFEFYKQDKAGTRSWETRFLINGEPDPSRANADTAKFYSLISTVKFTAEITVKSTMFGMRHEIHKKLSATITGLELVVTQGFKAVAAED
jgi:hypothetical protein